MKKNTAFKLHLAEEIEAKAQFRTYKAAEYPHDTRNKKCAESLKRLATWVRTLSNDDEALRQVEVALDFSDYGMIFWPRPRNPHERPQSEQLLLRFDFHNDPPTPTEFFSDVLKELAQAIEGDKEEAEGEEEEEAAAS